MEIKNKLFNCIYITHTNMYDVGFIFIFFFILKISFMFGLNLYYIYYYIFQIYYNQCWYYIQILCTRYWLYLNIYSILCLILAYYWLLKQWICSLSMNSLNWCTLVQSVKMKQTTYICSTSTYCIVCTSSENSPMKNRLLTYIRDSFS